MVYKWKETVHPNVPADVAGEVCSRLAEKGMLTAKNLVNESRPEDAPLHKCFEWDDSVAAELYREDQGRCIIRHLVVERDEPEEQEKEMPVRAFFQIAGPSSSYEPIHTIVKNEDKYSELLKIALGELKAFSRKYNNIKEFKKLYAEIDNIISLIEGGEDGQWAMPL